MPRPGYSPLIAVVAYHLAPGRVSRWPLGGYGVPGPYLEALRRAGARTALLPPGEPGDPEALLDPFDGLVLVGGGDVDPARYGAQPDEEHNYGIEPDRDEFEIELLLAADRLALPTLCICRGMQVMNVAFGGTLHQHLHDVPGLIEHGVPLEETQTMHDVAPETMSRLSALSKSDRPLSCASHHHQGVDRVGNGLRVTGRSEDGLVEAIERVVDDPYEGVWMVGVQWHPEETAEDDPDQQALFEALALLSRWRGMRARLGEKHGRSRDYSISDYDPDWARRFQDESARIRAALGDLVTRIDHIGSTSVPGLAAKPVVDIQVSVSSMVPRAAYLIPIVALGYAWGIDPVEDDHEYFSRDVDGERAFQIHVCRAGSEWERRHLEFRNWLQDRPDDAEAYARLKRHLASAHPRDLNSYVGGKTAFIRGIENRARAASRSAC